METPDGPHSMLGARIEEQSYKVPASHTGGPEKKTKTNNRERERGLKITLLLSEK